MRYNHLISHLPGKEVDLRLRELLALIERELKATPTLQTLQVSIPIPTQENTKYSGVTISCIVKGRRLHSPFLIDSTPEGEITPAGEKAIRQLIREMVQDIFGYGTNIPDDIQAQADAAGREIPYEYAQGRIIMVPPQTRKTKTDD
jgi:hypothetical protein